MRPITRRQMAKAKGAYTFNVTQEALDGLVKEVELLDKGIYDSPFTAMSVAALEYNMQLATQAVQAGAVQAAVDSIRQVATKVSQRL